MASPSLTIPPLATAGISRTIPSAGDFTIILSTSRESLIFSCFSWVNSSFFADISPVSFEVQLAINACLSAVWVVIADSSFKIAVLALNWAFSAFNNASFAER